NALIPGVTVQARNTATGISLVGVTNETGAYVFPVNSGTYQVSASLPGFQTKTVRGVQVTFNSHVRQDLQLSVAPVSAMVEVAAFDAFIPAARPFVGEFLAENRVRDLPLVGNKV